MLNTWSELTSCNAHLNDLDPCVINGAQKAADVPEEMLLCSASESGFQPTPMLFHNLVALNVQEAMRGCPMNGRASLAGDSKTTLSLLIMANPWTV